MGAPIETNVFYLKSETACTYTPIGVALHTASCAGTFNHLAIISRTTHWAFWVDGAIDAIFYRIGNDRSLSTTYVMSKELRVKTRLATLEVSEFSKGKPVAVMQRIKMRASRTEEKGRKSALL